MSQWYKNGSPLTYTVQKSVQTYYEGKEYRFAKWVLPDGNKQYENNLTWIITSPGKVNAIYDTYYRLKIFTPYGAKIEGENWYKAGETAQWSVHSPIDQPSTNLLGNMGLLKLKPIPSAGTIKMDSPKEYTIEWHEDYRGFLGTIAPPVIGTLIAALIIYLIKRWVNKDHKQSLS